MYAKRLRRIANALSEREKNKSRLIKKTMRLKKKNLNNNKNVRRYGRRGVTPMSPSVRTTSDGTTSWVSGSLGIKQKIQKKKKKRDDDTPYAIRTAKNPYAFKRAKRSYNELAKGAHAAVGGSPQTPAASVGSDDRIQPRAGGTRYERNEKPYVARA